MNNDTWLFSALWVWNTFSLGKIDLRKIAVRFSLEHLICELTVPQVEHLLESILKTYTRLQELGFTYYNGKIVVIDTEEVENV